MKYLLAIFLISCSGTTETRNENPPKEETLSETGQSFCQLYQEVIDTCDPRNVQEECKEMGKTIDDASFEEAYDCLNLSCNDIEPCVKSYL